MNPQRNVSLHSRYNPQGEAERYIGSLSLNESIRFCILIEPGLGYLIAPLKKRLPAARIIALHASASNSAEPCSEQGSNFRDNSPCSLMAPDSEWRPGTSVSVQDFLESEIPDSEAAEIRILEWRPALAVYGELYLSLVEETTEFIKRSDANARTLKTFGRRWFRNFFRNLDIIRNVLCPVPLSLPLLVTGAGPSLEEAIPHIKNASRDASRDDSLFILAVSSSVAALKTGNLVPNMVISTDGGQWAAFHLYECYRGKEASPCPLAAALTATLPSQCGALPVLPISDGSLWQTLILNELKIPFIVLPQRGTVTAAALDLAFALTKGNIYISGMDLANQDIQSHARPYSFDRFLEEKANRLNPVYSQTFSRSSMLKAGGSYGIYASWFEKQIASYPRRLFSLGKNNPLFGSLETSTFETSTSETAPDKVPAQFKIFTLESEDLPSQKALAFLEKTLENALGNSFQDSIHSAKLEEELGSLLLPGRTTPSLKELIEALHTFSSAWDRSSPQYG